MRYIPVSLPADLSVIQSVAQLAFSATLDASLDQWFSFPEMQMNTELGRGICMKAIDDLNKIVGMLYAQEESPINGREGSEKWVVVITAIDPSQTGKGIGSGLLRTIEQYAKERGAIKMFAYTNKGDKNVIHFYQKNGYQDVGWIKDYQYGKDNTAVFLLKYL